MPAGRQTRVTMLFGPYQNHANKIATPTFVVNNPGLEWESPSTRSSETRKPLLVRLIFIFLLLLRTFGVLPPLGVPGSLLRARHLR